MNIEDAIKIGFKLIVISFVQTPEDVKEEQKEDDNEKKEQKKKEIYYIQKKTSH